MKRIAIYPGSFNPFHDGHLDIVNKMLPLFDKIIIAQCINPAKAKPEPIELDHSENISIISFQGFLSELIDETKACAVIRGLRDPNDFIYEQKQQYWYEDSSIIVPIIYAICDRQLTHVSSSALRSLAELERRIEKK